MSEQIKSCYEFGPYVMDPGKRVLLRGGETVPLAAKVLETLIVLVENRARVLSKEELLKHVWGDTIVEEGGLARNISILRKVLGAPPDHHQYIVTLPGRGYQFVADVQARPNGEPVAAPPPSVSNGMRSSKHPWALRGVVLGGVAALVLGGVYLLRLQRSTGATSLEFSSLAVLPLENLSADPAQQYLADKMTDRLITSVSHVHKLRVVSKTSVAALNGSKRPLPEIARALRADAVVEGSVQSEEGRVKVVVRLIHASTDTHLWARTYERDIKDISRLESEVATAVTKEVWTRFTPPEN